MPCTKDYESHQTGTCTPLQDGEPQKPSAPTREDSSHTSTIYGIATQEKKTGKDKVEDIFQTNQYTCNYNCYGNQKKHDTTSCCLLPTNYTW